MLYQISALNTATVTLPHTIQDEPDGVKLKHLVDAHPGLKSYDDAYSTNRPAECASARNNGLPVDVADCLCDFDKPYLQCAPGFYAALK